MSQPALTIPAHFNVAAGLLRRRLAADAAKPAIDAADRVWTYGEIADLVHRAGNGFRALGVGREARILIVLPDSVEFVAAFLGAAAIGAVAVPSSTFLGAAEYGHFLRDTRAPLLVTTSDLLARMGTAPRDAADLRTILLVDAIADDDRVRSWRRWVEGASSDLTPADTHKDEAAFWLWTSGSTGEPKAAVHLHQDPPWCAELYGSGVIGLHAGDRVYSAAKLFHAYGLGNSLFLPFWVGATSILSPGRSTPDNAFSVIARTRPTVFFGVPTLYAAMLQHADADPALTTPTVRFAVSAGEPLPGELYLRWKARFGSEILDGIGSTELLHMYISARAGRVKAGSSGQPVPGYDVKIVNEAGVELPPGDVGDLLVRGPSTAIMYWNRREQTKQKMRGEWFASGDKYTVDADGYYWYAGRTDDMFKVNGEWVSPIEIESVLVAHDAILECAVVSYEESPGALKAKACVVLKDGWSPGDGLVRELQAFVRDRAAHYKCPRVIEFLPDLPKTATGKIQRFKLR